MRALLIGENRIDEVTIGIPIVKMQALLEGRQVTREMEKNATLTTMYSLIDCQYVTGAGYPDATHAAWADDEGFLIVQDQGGLVTFPTWYPQPLFGKILVTGFDPETGKTTPATLSVDALWKMIERQGVARKE